MSGYLGKTPKSGSGMLGAPARSQPKPQYGGPFQGSGFIGRDYFKYTLAGRTRADGGSDNAGSGGDVTPECEWSVWHMNSEPGGEVCYNTRELRCPDGQGGYTVEGTQYSHRYYCGAALFDMLGSTATV